MYWQNNLNSPVLPLSRGVFGHLGDQILLYLTKIVPSVSAAELPLCQLLDLSIFLPLSLLFHHLVLCEHFRNTVQNPLIKIGWSKKSTDACQYRQKEVGKDMFIKCFQLFRSTFILSINSWEMHPAWGSKFVEIRMHVCNWDLENGVLHSFYTWGYEETNYTGYYDRLWQGEGLLLPSLGGFAAFPICIIQVCCCRAALGQMVTACLEEQVRSWRGEFILSQGKKMHSLWQQGLQENLALKIFSFFCKTLKY